MNQFPRAYQSDPVAAAAVRLLCGAGSATLAVRGSTGRGDVLDATSHCHLGGGVIRLSGTLAPWSRLFEVGTEGLEVIVVIDEFAPQPGVRVLVGSVRARGAVRGVLSRRDGTVRVEVSLGELAVSRLGTHGTISASSLDSVPADPVAAHACAIAREVIVQYGAALAPLAGTPGSAEPRVLAVDAQGLDLLTGTGSDLRVVRLPFREPARQVGEVLGRVAQLIGDAA